MIRRVLFGERGASVVPRITIEEELYEKIEAQARKEGISASKLAEKLLMEVTTPKQMSCPRCAFRFS